MNNHISSIAKKLLISNIFFRAGNIITKIFVNIYIFKTTGDLKIVAGFSLMLLVFHFISYSIFSGVVKYGYRSISHIIGILGVILIFLSFIFFPENIGKYALYIGGFLGFFSGIYWCVYNVHQFDVTQSKNRGNFEGLKKSLRTVVALTVPVIAGTIIAVNYAGLGYQSVFLLGIIFYSISGILGIIPSHIPNNSSLKMKELIFHVYKHPDIWKILLMLFCISFALSLPLIEVIFPLIFFTRGMEEFEIGVFVSLISVVSIIASYLFGKFVHYKYYKLSFISAAGIYLLLLGLLILYPTGFMLGIFISSVTFLYVFVDIPLSVFASNVTHEIPNYKILKEEFILLREFFVIAGRALTFLVIFFLGSFSNFSMQVLFGTMAFMILISMILFYSTNMSHE